MKEMPDMYQLKWKFNRFNSVMSDKTWHYGIQDRYSKEAEKNWKNGGLLTIEDAITPETYTIDPKEIAIKQIELTGLSFHNEYNKFVDSEHKKALKGSNEAKGLKGKIFRLGVGDGFAWYEVIKESSSKVKVEWRGFGGDRYHDQILGWGGTFDKNRIKSFCTEKYDLKMWNE